MKRRFNINGSCNPKRNYMVDISDRLKKIKENYVDYGSYFVINKGRQYGKTTTLQALTDYLSDEYFVFSPALISMLCDAFQFEEGEEQKKIRSIQY